MKGTLGPGGVPGPWAFVSQVWWWARKLTCGRHPGPLQGSVSGVLGCVWGVGCGMWGGQAGRGLWQQFGAWTDPRACLAPWASGKMMSRLSALARGGTCRLQDPA